MSEDLIFNILKFFVEYGLLIFIVLFLCTLITSIKFPILATFIGAVTIIFMLIYIESQNYILNLKMNEKINYYELINYEKISLYEDDQVKEYYLITYLKDGKEITDKVLNSDWYINFYNVDNYKNIVEIHEYEAYSTKVDIIQKKVKYKTTKYKIFEKEND